MDVEIFNIATILMEELGDDALSFALRETMRYIREEDVKKAGRWLVIGQAVETLTGMPSALRRH